MTAYMSVFSTLNSIDVSSKIEEKNGLSFLPWAYAWAELKKLYPDSYYTIYERPDGVNYFTDGKTCWVKTGVTVVDGDWSLEHIESLPVMNVQNRSIPAANVTSFDVNKAIQRSLTKAIARHGLGLYVYAGEDLPEALSAELDGLRTAIRDAMRRAWGGLDAKARDDVKLTCTQRFGAYDCGSITDVNVLRDMLEYALSLVPAA